uniref:Uncharacterized protein n=1 Tax=Meloidogyne enterolobii TaxID=390850 RepID=A0A6V7WQS1_MELEN|nr:unnamed protein product [Meloidogyne enterolobii]
MHTELMNFRMENLMKRSSQQSFANIGLILDGVEVGTLVVFLHPLNDKRTQNDENLNENENKVSDSSANLKDENSSVRGGKKNFGSLLSLSNDPPPSQKISGGSNNQKINNNNNNTAKINSLNNCFLSANRLKFPTIPPPLMTENVWYFWIFS